MKPTFRYYYDNGNRPVVTVCELEGPHGKTKGVAICSAKDVPCKKTGRKIALDRATYAMKMKSGELINRSGTVLPIFRIEALEVLESAGVNAYDEKVLINA